MPLRKTLRPRDTLRQVGIDESQFNRLTDHAPIDGSDEETIIKVLYRLPLLFTPYDLEKWVREANDLESALLHRLVNLVDDLFAFPFPCI